MDASPPLMSLPQGQPCVTPELANVDLNKALSHCPRPRARRVDFSLKCCLQLYMGTEGHLLDGKLYSVAEMLILHFPLYLKCFMLCC